MYVCVCVCMYVCVCVCVCISGKCSGYMCYDLTFPQEEVTGSMGLGYMYYGLTFPQEEATESMVSVIHVVWPNIPPGRSHWVHGVWDTCIMT